MAAGGLLAFPRIIRASALASGPAAPSERIRMGIIGVGGQGSGHLFGGAWTYVPGGLAGRSDVQVVAICDVWKHRREGAAQRCRTLYAERAGTAGFQGVEAYNDVRELLARDDIDAVLIAVPYHWAAPIAMAAMKAGKDVYCEKPVAITVEEGRRLVQVAAQYGRVYQAGTQQRSDYGGKFRRACELVQNGRIGQLKEVFVYSEPGILFPKSWAHVQVDPAPEGLDWDRWLGPLPLQPLPQALRDRRGMQCLPDMFVGDVNWTPHRYDIGVWGIGADPSAPFDIECARDARGEPLIRYHFANGVTMHGARYPNEPVGEDGGACFVGTEGRIAVDRGHLVAYPASILDSTLTPHDRRLYQAQGHMENFLHCVRTRRTPICDAATAVRSMETILVGGAALVLNRSLRWSPSAGEFLNDPTANRLLSYTPRAPWTLA